VTSRALLVAIAAAHCSAPAGGGVALRVIHDTPAGDAFDGHALTIGDLDGDGTSDYVVTGDTATGADQQATSD
jgi:hypothetical protein